jgi:hypothetical protein
MAKAEKEKNCRVREAATSSGMTNAKVRVENFYRDAAKIRKANMGN